MSDSGAFLHDSNARNDDRILQLRLAHGWEGYGLYWAIIEMLREANGHALNIAAIPALALGLATAPEKVQAVIDLAIQLGLLKSDGKRFWSDSLNRRMDEYEQAKARRVERAKKAAAARYQGTGTDDADETAVLGQCSSSAQAVLEQSTANSNTTVISFKGEGGAGEGGTSPDPLLAIDLPRLKLTKSQFAALAMNHYHGNERKLREECAALSDHRLAEGKPMPADGPAAVRKWQRTGLELRKGRPERPGQKEPTAQELEAKRIKDLELRRYGAVSNSPVLNEIFRQTANKLGAKTT